MNARNEGGAMGGVEELYREVILDHFKSPRNKGKLNRKTSSSEGLNPLCGDQISVEVLIENGRIKEIGFEGHGCAISQSSASMMTAAVKGKTVDEAASAVNAFKRMFGIAEAAPGTPVELGDLEALEGVKKYPVRIKCALLSWNTLQQAMSDAGK